MTAELDLSALAADVGGDPDDAVSAVGLGTRGGGHPSGRPVRAPAGLVQMSPEEMTVRCGAGTGVDDLQAALAEVGQEAALPPGGTVGGALAVGRADVWRLGRGPVRDVLLQARYVNAAGQVVKAGGPTVKNVSGFDLCRVLVGSRGTLGVLGEVILRSRPIPAARQWFVSEHAPDDLLVGLYRPMSILWDGAACWVCLEGHPMDVADSAARFDMYEVDGPPEIPTAHRWSIRPADLHSLAETGRFVAEVGVGVVHHADQAPPARLLDPGVAAINERIRRELDPAGRFSVTSRDG